MLRGRGIQDGSASPSAGPPEPALPLQLPLPHRSFSLDTHSVPILTGATLGLLYGNSPQIHPSLLNPQLHDAALIACLLFPAEEGLPGWRG